MKSLVGAFNQEKALVGSFSVITNLRIDLIVRGAGYVCGAAGACKPLDQGRNYNCKIMSLTSLLYSSLELPGAAIPPSQHRMRADEGPGPQIYKSRFVADKNFNILKALTRHIRSLVLSDQPIKPHNEGLELRIFSKFVN